MQLNKDAEMIMFWDCTKLDYVGDIGSWNEDTPELIIVANLIPHGLVTFCIMHALNLNDYIQRGAAKCKTFLFVLVTDKSIKTTKKSNKSN